MNFNLLNEKWLPVFRQDGTRDWIAPHQVVERENPPVAFAGRLPEYNSAYTQFMVGLIQTSCPPSDQDAHLEGYEDLPNPEDLQKAFAHYEEAFYLVHEDPNHPRFFQTPLHRVEDSSDDWVKPVSQLSHQSGSVTITTDHNPIPYLDAVDLKEAAALLLSQQIEGSGGAGGYYTSLRCGGPITAILQSQISLWKTLWLNVIPHTEMQTLHSETPDKGTSDKIFSWMREDLSGAWDKSSSFKAVSQGEVSPLFIFWSISKNIRLLIDDDLKVRHMLYTTSLRFVTKAGEGWRHPMTPYVPANKSHPVRAQNATVDFDLRDWVVASYSLGKQNPLEYLPATLEIFEANSDLKEALADAGDTVTIRLTGPCYDSNQAKILGYMDRVFPILSNNRYENATLKSKASALVSAYKKMEKCIKTGLYVVGLTYNDHAHFNKAINIWYEYESDIISALYRWKASGTLQEDDSVLEEILNSVRDRFLVEYARLCGMRSDGRGRRRRDRNGNEISLLLKHDKLRKDLNKVIKSSLTLKEGNE